MKYCESIYQTKRRSTREVFVGNIGIGGKNPVRIQSMTTSNTRDIEATIEQAVKLVDAGCEIVRMTVQGIKEAEACEHIKNGLLKRGYSTPLVADIHFFPPAAFKAAEFVDKVRINPGNFVDKRAQFKVIEYDDLSYAKELEKIEEKFTPLVEKCKTLKRAMRIGTNHGSLSDRIMNRFGDTPRGMVESALEFARICRKNDYHDIIFSMKSSNPQVMILAYRLLAAEMEVLGWDYPLHLGVTEAGEGEDGRIKSAMGIGSLLLDGIGDTIRVSLTEDPWFEIDPCQRLVRFASSYEGAGVDPFQEKHRNFQDIQRVPVDYPKHFAMHRNGSVWVAVDEGRIARSDFFQAIGCEAPLGQVALKVNTVDGIVLKEPLNEPQAQKKIQRLQETGIGLISSQELNSENHAQIIDLSAPHLHLDRFALKFAAAPRVVTVRDEPFSAWALIEQLRPAVICLSPSKNRLHFCRRFFEWLKDKQLSIPVMLNFHYDCSKEDLVIRAASEYGALLCDGLGEGIWLEGPYETEFLRNLSFNILQAARMRTSKTDFISCPSCGRTLFDLQEVTKRIHARTAHLPGVKIAIMGCIVNGPGEMADADFGYVGSKPGMIDLYIGKSCVEKNIPFEEADDRLVDLIKSNGRWQEPS